MKPVIITICFVLLVPMVCACGAELLVPSQYPTIQAAVNAATNGDTVIIAPGTYTGDGNINIDLKGKSITVRSKNGPHDCIIDCNGTLCYERSGFYIYQEEDANTIIDGFTIINGNRSSNGQGGGAFGIYGASPTIKNCWMFKNIGVYGGAILCDRSNARITNCIIADNYGWLGSGIFCNNSSTGWCPGPRNGGPEISNCLFTGNVARMDDFFDVGAIFCYNSDTLIRNCTIANNNYGIFVLQGDVEIDNCIIQNENYEICTPDWYWPTVKVADCLIRDFKIREGDNSTIILLEGSINTTTPFNDSCGGDYHLPPDSPCINAGDPNYMPEPNETDLDGKPRVIGGRIDMGAYEYQNTAPVADAGPNQVAYAWIDGIAEVNLDGSDSYDADGDNLKYHWKWVIDGNTYEANGVDLSIELPVGQYTFELTAYDGIEYSEPNQVTITVIEPIKSMLWVTPRIVDNSCFKQQYFMAIMQLPAGITRKQIDPNVKLVCYPGEIKANRQFIMSYFDYKRVERVVIWAYFDSNSLTDNVIKTGWVDVDIVGQLKTGQYFYGSDNVWVIKPPRKPIWCQPKYWWGWGGISCGNK
jgi:hypothetical protein